MYWIQRETRSPNNSVEENILNLFFFLHHLWIEEQIKLLQFYNAATRAMKLVGAIGILSLFPSSFMITRLRLCFELRSLRFFPATLCQENKGNSAGISKHFSEKTCLIVLLENLAKSLKLFYTKLICASCPARVEIRNCKGNTSRWPSV